MPREQRFGAYRRTLPRLRAHTAAAPLRRDASSRAPSFSDCGFWRASRNSTPRASKARIRVRPRGIRTRRRDKKTSRTTQLLPALGPRSTALAVVSRGDGVASPSQSEVIFAKTQRRRRAETTRCTCPCRIDGQTSPKLICVALYFFYNIWVS